MTIRSLIWNWAVGPHSSPLDVTVDKNASFALMWQLNVEETEMSADAS